MLEHRLQVALQMLPVWCWLVKRVLVRSPLNAYERYVVVCLKSEDDLIFFSSFLFFFDLSWSWSLASDRFVCHFADGYKCVIFVLCQSFIFESLEILKIKLPRYWNGFHRSSRRFSSILLQWLNIIYCIKYQAVNS